MAATGTVKFFSLGKGFGFIVQDDGSPDIFVHGSNVTGSGLSEGDKVQFEVEVRDDGRARAINVHGGTNQGYVYGENNAMNNNNNFGNNNNNFGNNNGYGGNQGGYGGGNQGGYGGNQGGYGGNQGGYGGNQGGNSGGGQPCFTFRDQGSCQYGDQCKYSHQM